MSGLLELIILLVGISLGTFGCWEVMHRGIGCRKHPIKDQEAEARAQAVMSDEEFKEWTEKLSESNTLVIMTRLSYLIESHQHAGISAADTLSVIREETRRRTTQIRAKNPETLLRDSVHDPFGPFSVA